MYFLFFKSELSLEVLAVCWSCVYNVNFHFFLLMSNLNGGPESQNPATTQHNDSWLWLDRTQVPGNSYTLFSVFMVHCSVLIFFKWAFRRPRDILKRQLDCMKLSIVLLWRVFLPYLLSDSPFWQETEALIPLCSLQCHQTPLTKTVILPDRTHQLLVYRCLGCLVCLCHCVPQ